MPAYRIFAAAAIAAVLFAPIAAPRPANAADAPIRVALIVGPMGSQTSGNRSRT